jgi:hypothetical protein
MLDFFLPLIDFIFSAMKLALVDTFRLIASSTCLNNGRVSHAVNAATNIQVASGAASSFNNGLGLVHLLQ